MEVVPEVPSAQGNRNQHLLHEFFLYLSKNTAIITSIGLLRLLNTSIVTAVVFETSDAQGGGY